MVSSFKIEPASDVSMTGWSPTPAWSRLDGSDFYDTNASVSADGICTLTNGTVDGGNVIYKITIGFRGFYQYSGSGTIYVSWRIGAGGDWSSEESFVLTTGETWHTETWDNLEDLGLDDADADDLQIRFRLVGSGARSHRLFECDVNVYHDVAPSGWAHEFMGIPGANIDSVNGIPIANIDTIKGV